MQLIISVQDHELARYGNALTALGEGKPARRWHAR